MKFVIQIIGTPIILYLKTEIPTSICWKLILITREAKLKPTPKTLSLFHFKETKTQSYLFIEEYFLKILSHRSMHMQ